MDAANGNPVAGSGSNDNRSAWFAQQQGDTRRRVQDVDNSTFWSRVARWFKQEVGPTRGGIEEEGTEEFAIGAVVGGGAHHRKDAVADAGAGNATLNQRSSVSSLDAPRSKEEHDRIAPLVSVMEKYLITQGERLEAANRALDRLVEAADSAPRAVEAYTARLSTISESVSALTAGIRRMEEGLMPLPQLADAQRETMVAIGRQLDESRQVGEKTSQTMETVGQGLAELAEATNASINESREARRENASREQQLATLLEEQTRRLTVFGSVLIALAAVATVIALIGLFR